MNIAQCKFGATRVLLITILPFLCITEIYAADKAINVERVNSRDAAISNINLPSTSEGLRITGYLRKSMSQKGHIPGHLHLEILDHNDQLLIETQSNYHRHNRNSKYSHFSEQLSVDPDKVGKVRVIHHGLNDKST